MIMLVDGYNLLHNLPECTYDLKHDLEATRDYLIGKLSRYASDYDVEVRVIFDAHYTNHLKTSIKKQVGIRIVYTKTDETADNYIINWIKKYHQGKYIEVITSDQVELLNSWVSPPARQSNLTILAVSRILFWVKKENLVLPY